MLEDNLSFFFKAIGVRNREMSKESFRVKYFPCGPISVGAALRATPLETMVATARTAY